MITEQDLQAAIAECEGQRNPNANVCTKLAAFYTIKDHLYPAEKDHTADMGRVMYSGASAPIISKPMLESGTEFAEIANRIDFTHLMPVMDELMETIRVLHPRLYEGVLRKLEN